MMTTIILIYITGTLLCMKTDALLTVLNGKKYYYFKSLLVSILWPIICIIIPICVALLSEETLSKITEEINSGRGI